MGKTRRRRRRLRFKDWRKPSQQTRPDAILKTAGLGLLTLGAVGAVGVELLGLSMLVGLSTGFVESRKKQLEEVENSKKKALQDLQDLHKEKKEDNENDEEAVEYENNTVQSNGGQG